MNNETDLCIVGYIANVVNEGNSGTQCDAQITRKSQNEKLPEYKICSRTVQRY